MNRKSSILMAAIAFLVFACLPLTMKGDELTWIPREQNYSHGQVMSNAITFNAYLEGLFAKGTGSTSPTYYNASGGIKAGVRLYKNNQLTITPHGANILKIEFTFYRTSANYIPTVTVEGGGTYESGGTPTKTDSVVDTWTGNTDKDLIFKYLVNTARQRLLSKIKITYSVSGSVTTYTLNYDANGGSGTAPATETYNVGTSVLVKPCMFTYTNYAFSKWNTASDGSGTSYYPGQTITMYNNMTLYAQWTHIGNGKVDVLTPTNVNAGMESGSGYLPWTVTLPESGSLQTTYNGISCYNSNYIQITNSTSGSSKHSGIVTTAWDNGSGVARKVEVLWNSQTATNRVLQVYGSNVPYTSTENLYSSAQGTLLGTITYDGTNTYGVLNITDDYAYIGLRSASGAMYFNEISVTWDVNDEEAIYFTPSAINLGNLIRDEECTTSFYVSQQNIGGPISLSSYVDATLDPTTIQSEAAPRLVNWTYTPAAAGTLSETVTATATWTDGNDVEHHITKELHITGTVLDPAAGTTIAAAKTAFINNNTSAAVINLAKVEVVGQYGSFLYLQDKSSTEVTERRGLLVYGSGAPSFATGDQFNSGSLTGTLTNYNGIFELTNFSFQNYEVTHGHDLTPITASINALLNDNNHVYEHCYVQVGSATISISNYVWTINDGSTLVLNDRLDTGYANCTEPDGTVSFTVKGLFNPYYASNALQKELVPTTVYDIHTTTLAATPTFTPNNPSTDFANPTLTTTFTISPAANTNFEYEIDRDNRIQSNTTVTINIAGETTVRVKVNRDFYTSIDWVSYYFNLPAGVKSVNFNINGTVEGPVYVALDGQLQAVQCPSVDAIDDYTFRGWSIDPSSTTTIDLPYPYNDISNNMTLYAVYGKATAHTYNQLSSPSELGEGEYIIVGNNGMNDYVLKNTAASSSPTAYLLSDLGLSINNGEMSGTDFSEVTWTIAGSNLTEMTVTSTANTANRLYFSNSSTGVRVGSSDHTFILRDDDRNAGRFNLKDNTVSRSLALYSDEQWRCYLDGDMYNTNNYPALKLFKKTPLNQTTDVRYIRVFNNVTATEDLTISGPSIIPSGYYLNMGNHSLKCEDANLLLIEDGATFVPRANNNQTMKATVKKNVAGYGTNTEAQNGWYLLASPVGLVNSNNGIGQQGHGTVTGLYGANETNYDLYIFDQSESLPWRNNKQMGENGTTFGNGNGILYASQVDRTITYTGNLADADDFTNMPLAYSGEANFTGWNLVGNPFICDATASRDYYKLVDVVNNGTMVSELQPATTSESVGPMEGVFMQANSANENYTFTPVTPQGSGNNGNNGEGLLNITVVSERGLVVDRALAHIGEGSMLGKFMLNENGTKLYIPQGGKDYAVVRAQGEGELPINFKAAKSGSFTLRVVPENIEMAYLHLIDNLTGADVDMLNAETVIAGEDPQIEDSTMLASQSPAPAYTFTARPTDYASRFRLVFRASQVPEPVEGMSNFAYFDGSSWQVSNTGEATLQVVDVLGRIVSSQTINGNASINVSETAGVYVLRLVNGENVKVQKIVIK